MSRNFVRVARSVVLVLLVAPLSSLAGGAMKMTAVSFPLPTDSEPIALSGLTYGGMGGTVAVTSVSLEVASSEGDTPVHAEWTLTASNTKPQARRVQVRIFLLNEAKKRISSGRKTVLIRGNVDEQELELEMEVKEGVWARAERVYLEVDFLSR